MAGVDWDDELPENLKIKWEELGIRTPTIVKCCLSLVVCVEHTQRTLNYTYFQMLLMTLSHQLPI